MINSFDNLFKFSGMVSGNYQPAWFPYEESDSILNSMGMPDFYIKVWRKRTNLFKGRFEVTSQDISQSETVLDLGCNIGWNSFESACSGAGSVHGIDISKETIQICRALKGNNNITNVSFESSNIKNFLEKNNYRYECVLFFFLFHHIQRKDNSSACRVLDSISSQSKICFIQARSLGGMNELDFVNLLKKYFKNGIEKLVYKKGFGTPNAVYKCIS